MQIDMHYYGVFALARAAGLDHEAARIVATASQFVDDNGDKGHVAFDDGGRIDFEATAHHTTHFKNIDEVDQRQICVPFHFLPGGEGDRFLECLVCRKDSQLARKMVDHALANMDRSFALELAGLTAHVYADTFSHYGFSGISAAENKVVNDSFDLGDLEPSIREYIAGKAADFLEKYGMDCGRLDNILSSMAERFSCALGHGAVLTYPDRPYLVWSFAYEKTGQRCETRNNPRTFLDACRALYNFFGKIAEARPEYSEGSPRKFEDLEDTITRILKKQADRDGRIGAWRSAVSEGLFFGDAQKTVPTYGGESWLGEADVLEKRPSGMSTGLSLFRFYQAAALHRTYVLRDLLPSHGLVVA